MPDADYYCIVNEIIEPKINQTSSFELFRSYRQKQVGCWLLASEFNAIC